MARSSQMIFWPSIRTPQHDGGGSDGMSHPHEHWTVDETDRLVAMANQGMARAEIAKRLGNGRTRNSVIGKLYRMDYVYDPLAAEPAPSPPPSIPICPHPPHHLSHPARSAGTAPRQSAPRPASLAATTAPHVCVTG